MSEAATQELIAQLSASDIEQRRAAASAFMLSPENTQLALVPLCHAAGDPDEAVRESAVAALEECEVPKASACAGLSDLLMSETTDTAYWAATLLGRLGSDAKPWAADIAMALNGHSASAVRQRCAWALGKIGAADTAITDALSQAAKSDDSRLARLAESSLKKLSGS